MLRANENTVRSSLPVKMNPYHGRTDHLQRHRVAFNLPGVSIDLVRGETYVLALLLVRHVRQDQSLPGTALQWHSTIGEDLGPPGSVKKLSSRFIFDTLPYALYSLPRAMALGMSQTQSLAVRVLDTENTSRDIENSRKQPPREHRFQLDSHSRANQYSTTIGSIRKGACLLLSRVFVHSNGSILDLCRSTLSLAATYIPIARSQRAVDERLRDSRSTTKSFRPLEVAPNA